MFIQLKEVMMVSAPSSKNRNRGRRLMKKASLTAVLTWDRAQVDGRGWGLRVVKIGAHRRRKMMIKLEVIIVEAACIATTWICTKSFWFLRPTDELLSFRSRAVE